MLTRLRKWIDRFKNYRRLTSAFGPISLVALVHILSIIKQVETKIYGRYAGYNMDRLAHLIPVWLASRQKADDARFAHVEIGVLFGGSLAARLLLLEYANRCSQRVIGIDPLDSYYGEFIDPTSGLPISKDTVTENIGFLTGMRHNYSLVQRLSSDPAAVEKVRNREVLSLFIDGDHTYQQIREDWENYSPFVIPGGYVIFDDYGSEEWPDVRRFVDELVNNEPPAWRICGVVGRAFVIRRNSRMAESASPSLESTQTTHALHSLDRM